MALTAKEILTAQILPRRDTYTNWQTKNPVMATGEIGIDTTYNRIKTGIGTNWNSTPYSDGAYLFLDSQATGEKFRFYLPARSVLYRLDYSGGAAWRVSHNSGPKTLVRDMATGSPIAAGIFEFENGGTGPNLLTMVVIPADPLTVGKFDISSLGVEGAPVTSMYEEKLVVNVEQASHGMTAGLLVSHNGTAWEPATGEKPVLGLVEYASVSGYRIVLQGLTTFGEGSSLTPGAQYYRQADGTLGTVENGAPLFVATSTAGGVFARGGGGGATAGGIRPYETGKWNRYEVAISGTTFWQALQNISDSQSLPTQTNAFWKKIYEATNIKTTDDIPTEGAINLWWTNLRTITATATANLWNYIGLASSTATISLKGWLDFLTNKVKQNEDSLLLKADLVGGKLKTEQVPDGLAGATEIAFSAALKFDKNYKTTRTAATADALTVNTTGAVYHNRHTIYYTAGSVKPTFSGANWDKRWDNWDQAAVGGNTLTCVYLPNNKVQWTLESYG